MGTYTRGWAKGVGINGDVFRYWANLVVVLYLFAAEIVSHKGIKVEVQQLAILLKSLIS